MTLVHFQNARKLILHGPLRRHDLAESSCSSRHLTVERTQRDSVPRGRPYIDRVSASQLRRHRHTLDHPGSFWSDCYKRVRRATQRVEKRNNFQFSNIRAPQSPRDFYSERYRKNKLVIAGQCSLDSGDRRIMIRLIWSVRRDHDRCIEYVTCHQGSLARSLARSLRERSNRERLA